MRARIRGRMLSSGETLVEIRRADERLWRRLDPVSASRVRGRAPGGEFAWGYCGSGPSLLAFAILLDLEDVSAALRDGRALRDEAIAPLTWFDHRTGRVEPFDLEVDLDRWRAGDESAIRLHLPPVAVARW